VKRLVIPWAAFLLMVVELGSIKSAKWCHRGLKTQIMNLCQKERQQPPPTQIKATQTCIIQ